MIELTLPLDELRVLYVDDEAGLLDLIETYFRHYSDFDIDTAISAQEGLRKLHLSPYDVIVSDYEMPEMNGIEFLLALRSEGNTIPFIIFSGRRREEIEMNILNAGADHYIQKGGNPMATFAELKHHIIHTAASNMAQ
ncbi:response regulator [Methanofollis fontis]|uniref:response regulator n=1 Tax=Methanofollis fontis TaxID=2052832 RepID=UPI0013EE636E|nr:response regulator [Methanofollis fontis]